MKRARLAWRASQRIGRLSGRKPDDKNTERWPKMRHPLHSRDLVCPNSFLFPKLTSIVKGIYFYDVHDVYLQEVSRKILPGNVTDREKLPFEFCNFVCNTVVILLDHSVIEICQCTDCKYEPENFSRGIKLRKRREKKLNYCFVVENCQSVSLTGLSSYRLILARLQRRRRCGEITATAYSPVFAKLGKFHITPGLFKGKFGNHLKDSGRRSLNHLRGNNVDTWATR